MGCAVQGVPPYKSSWTHCHWWQAELIDVSLQLLVAVRLQAYAHWNGSVMGVHIYIYWDPDTFDIQDSRQMFCLNNRWTISIKCVKETYNIEQTSSKPWLLRFGYLSDLFNKGATAKQVLDIFPPHTSQPTLYEPLVYPQPPPGVSPCAPAALGKCNRFESCQGSLKFSGPYSNSQYFGAYRL